ncbi:MAG: MCE family protein [Kofleriaceae bacterium]|nr:MCE family protein [Kofleriaceae bacterium]MBP6835760.1 MCE family protein [Kofleriaceae bacterium]MBP9205124.1 MCE family protein [Kofleriaceae bacterium]
MASDRSLEFKVGLLLVIAAAILVGFVFVLGNFSLKSGFTVYVDYEYVGNLQEGAPIKVAGIKVGKVDDVRFLGGKVVDASGRRAWVRVAAWIENDAREAIRADAEFFINTAGVLGEQYLEVVPGRDFERPSIAAGAIVRGSDPPRTDLVVARLYEVLEGLSTVLRDDKDVIRDLLRNSASAVAEANRLLVSNREQVGRLIGGAAGLAEEATRTLGKVNQGLGDPRIVRSVLTSADGLLTSARGSLDAITPPAVALLTDARRATAVVTEQRVDRALAVADQAVRAVDKAGGLIDNVDGLVTDLRAGKGTAGALLVREDVYADLRELIRDLKRNPWKFFWKE